jgi:hypothetical protein
MQLIDKIIIIVDILLAAIIAYYIILFASNGIILNAIFDILGISSFILALFEFLRKKD